MYDLVRKAKKNQKGFTLVELMTVVVIIGILVAIAIPIMSNVTKAAAQRAHDSNLRTIDGAVQMYYAENSAWPATITALEGTYIEAGLTIPEATGLTGSYGLSDGTPPKAAPGGAWTGAYNSGETVATP